MIPTLPQPIAAYFAATNTHDIDAMLEPFADGAIVRDEGSGAARPHGDPRVDRGNDRKI